MSSKVLAPYYCSGCGNCCGDLSPEEEEVIISGDDNAGLCFDCSPLPARSKPEIFRNMLVGDVFYLGEWFTVKESLMGNDKLFPVALTHEGSRAPGLSSYTNLNRNIENLGVLENLYDDRICPGCEGLTFNFELYGGYPCRICEDLGSIKVLKKWVVSLIGGVRENV